MGRDNLQEIDLPYRQARNLRWIRIGLDAVRITETVAAVSLCASIALPYLLRTEVPRVEIPLASPITRMSRDIKTSLSVFNEANIIQLARRGY